MTKYAEFFPAELFEALQGVIAKNSDRVFLGAIERNNGYYAAFDGFENLEYVGCTVAQRSAYPEIGVYHVK